MKYIIKVNPFAFANMAGPKWFGAKAADTARGKTPLRQGKVTHILRQQ